MKPLYFTGCDIGSEFVHSVTLDMNNKIVVAPKSLMHFGNPVLSIKKIIKDNEKKGVSKKNSIFAFTGSGGEVFSKLIKAPYFYDSQTIPIGANYISPDAKYIFHIGSKDPYFFEIVETHKKSFHNDQELKGQNKVLDKSGLDDFRVFIPDFGTGTKCGGGSGILLNKQCRRLFSDQVKNRKDMQDTMEEMYKEAYKSALKSNKNIDVGGRCGVVIQSDMIHLQNSGENINNILRGLFERIAKNYKADVIRVRSLDKNQKAVITGGVGFNDLIVQLLEKNIGIKIEKPKNFEKVGAIGTALKLKSLFLENQIKDFGDLGRIDKVVEAEKKNITYAAPLSSYVKFVKVHEEKPIKKMGDLVIFNDKKDSIDCVMGVDGGSTTTKAVILDEHDMTPVCEICIETHGRPLQAAQRIFKDIKKYYKNQLKINAVAYTGSSGAFYFRLFTKNSGEDSTDLLIDEITCHAIGVKNFDKNVDTIFELGGQDAKFTLFSNDGTVKKAKMNLSCMAGTGQTMQNMVKMIGLDFDEFEKLALKSKRTPVVDETCGVFTEAGIARLVALGLPKEEIAAAIAYGFIGGYINKFVGNEKFGEYISAQGGPFKNLACLAALASHTKKKINAFPHRQLFGAYGAALAAHKKLHEN